MKQEELKKVLDLHSKWLRNEEGSIRADLRSADLRRADLSYADLRSAYLSGADLSYADLRRADLSYADLRSAYLSGADLRSAYLSYANLSGADLSGADLRSAYLSYANLSGADLSGAKLENVIANENTMGYFPLCPDGEFIAWKKLAQGKIAKLKIPAHAKRSSATTLKCRSSEAIVLAIYEKVKDEWVNVDNGYSMHKNVFKYEVGQTVKVDNFDEDRWNECSSGIHFFISREMAEQYK